jgi:nucleoside-diphosphate-sugar epimerase/phosphohistidine swiveling domain-containing protein
VNGRVLVTGGTGAFGIATSTWLSRLGHDVVVLARREPARLPARVRFVRGDVRDADSVRTAMADCDAVVHLAWAVSGSITHAAAAPLNLGGTENVLKAMADTGCGRLVFASSLTAYGGHPDHPQPWHEDEPLNPAYDMVYEFHKAEAEAMIVASGVPAVRVRPTVVVGRHAHNAPANVYRQPVIPNLGWGMQAIHQDDVGRFFAEACSRAATGAVNLAADDVVTWPEIARLSRRPLMPFPAPAVSAVLRQVGKVVPAAHSAPELVNLMAHFPIGDTTRLKTEFGFSVAWSSAEAFADQGRTSTSYIVLGMKEVRRPSRLDRVEDPGPASADPSGASVEAIDPAVAGEFDTVRVDPRYPTWTAANLAEAFPGPMTPLSLELGLEGLSTSAELIARILPVPEQLREGIRGRHLGTFGHRLYTNISVVEAMVLTVPGQTPEDFRYQTMGIPYPDDFRRPRPTPRDLMGFARFGVLSGPRLAGLDKAADRVVQRAHELAAQSAGDAALSDARLLARISVLWDDTVAAWQVGNTCTFMVSGPTAILERKYGREAVLALRTGSATLPSARLLHGIGRLAATARADAGVRSLLEGVLDDTAVARLRSEAPAFAREVDALLAECGHRGPGETELANTVYADSPALLLRTIARSMGDRSAPAAGAAPPTGLAARLGKVALKAIERRERARDAVTLTIHQLRKALREWERRLIERGRLTEPGDVFYLRRDEVYAANARDFRDLVARRRAERLRLAALEVPTEFTGRIEIVAAAPASSAVGAVLAGIPASPGAVRGRVRRMRSPDDDLDEGDVLVTSVTDTGWTPFFGVAAAVVTEHGGLMSHASIVAREFGIPAVVGLNGACSRLTDGQLVEVDGVAGTVTVLEA